MRNLAATSAALAQVQEIGRIVPQLLRAAISDVGILFDATGQSWPQLRPAWARTPPIRALPDMAECADSIGSLFPVTLYGWQCWEGAPAVAVELGSNDRGFPRPCGFARLCPTLRGKNDTVEYPTNAQQSGSANFPSPTLLTVSTPHSSLFSHM